MPECTGLKRPTHHFYAHLARDIWLSAAPRGYWCFGYDAFNKVIKAGAQQRGQTGATDDHCKTQFVTNLMELHGVVLIGPCSLHAR